MANVAWNSGCANTFGRVEYIYVHNDINKRILTFHRAYKIVSYSTVTTNKPS